VTAYRNSGINSENAYWDPPMKATSVRSADHKLIAYTSGDSVEYEFFDFRTDPKEQINRFGDPAYADATIALFQELGGWLQREAGLFGSRGGGWFPNSDSFMENAVKKPQ
jgi:hypothetical protein